MLSRLGAALLLAVALGGCDRQSAAPGQADRTTTEAPAPRGGAVDRSHHGELPPAARLVDADGRPITLASFRGRPVLVNLWATWCAPCVAELPSLDRAADGVTALAVNQGEEAAKVAPFLAKRALTRLRPLFDPDMTISMGLPANLPTTILYDADGRERWRVTGGRDWTSAESRRLIAEAEGQRS